MTAPELLAIARHKRTPQQNDGDIALQMALGLEMLWASLDSKQQAQVVRVLKRMAATKDTGGVEP